MPEKMTPKEVADALSWLHSKEGHFNEAGKLRAHIAAVEAERDEALRFPAEVSRVLGYAGPVAGLLGAVESLANNASPVRETLTWTLAELDECHAENLALRERVKALEAWCLGFRQRVKEAGLANEDQDYILGEGAALESTPEVMVAPVCRLPHPESTTCMDRTCLQCAPPAPEPTTAEAFATLHAAGLARLDEHERAALARLKRRMGAMVRALRLVREAHYPASDDHDTPGCRCVQCSVRDALADAPPVFTLEEVEQVLRREELGPATARRVREALAALRR